MALNARGFFYIQQVEQLARRVIDQCLQAEGMTAGQYMTLSLVIHHEPVSSADLARRTNITAQSMGEFIKALESKGMVERQTDPANRRVIQVKSTELGRKTLVRSEAKVDHAEHDFFSCLSGEEYVYLRMLLNRVRAAQQPTDK